MLFLNGLPVVVIECKSPKVKDAIPEAIDQILRYGDQRGATGEGSARLFYYNQFVVATCRQEAKFGTITTRSEKYFYRWADPYPRTVDELEHGTGGPNDQQRLVAGMLDRGNLLDLIRTYTLFSVNDKGETIKIVGRYQQFRAVKLAVKRLLEGGSPRGRSGIVWHTQGSGKSLTMMFLVREMYRHATLSGWKVVFVTDRTQLERQLSETSRNVGFTVKVADNIPKLKELLRADTSDLVMAMIHKFRETDLAEAFPELNTSPHILVMTDEAHRSQYRMLGANLDRAIPNATRIGYTGTPIDKTERVFGDYIDRYTMRQSIEDGVTLQIIYEGRTHKAEVPDRAALDTAFEDVFSECDLQERLKILGYGSRDAYLEAESTIEAKARDMVDHYLTHVYPNGYKAQVVATSREAAARYKTHVDAALGAAVKKLEQLNPGRLDLIQLRAMRTDVIISGKHNSQSPSEDSRRRKPPSRRHGRPGHPGRPGYVSAWRFTPLVAIRSAGRRAPVLPSPQCGRPPAAPPRTNGGRPWPSPSTPRPLPAPATRAFTPSKRPGRPPSPGCARSWSRTCPSCPLSPRCTPSPTATCPARTAFRCLRAWPSSNPWATRSTPSGAFSGGAAPTSAWPAICWSTTRGARTRTDGCRRSGSRRTSWSSSEWRTGLGIRT